MIASFSPYLHFNGNCEEAINFYAKVFDGTIQYMSRYSEGEFTGKVMHVHFCLPGGGVICAGDNIKTYEHGNTMDMHVMIDNAEQARKVFHELAEGGQIVSDIEPNPAPDDGSMSGLLVDQFGFTWIITSPV